MKRKITAVIILLILSSSLNVILIIQLTKNNSEDLQLKQPIYKSHADATDNPIILGDPLDVQDLPSIVNSWDLSEHGWTWLYNYQKVDRPLVYNDHDVSAVHLSPSHKRLGFFFHPENHSFGETVLAILDIDKKIVREVYHGDTRTSNWEWKGDEALIVKRSCGTGCMNASVINISTGKKIEEYRVY